MKTYIIILTAIIASHAFLTSAAAQDGRTTTRQARYSVDDGTWFPIAGGIRRAPGTTSGIAVDPRDPSGNTVNASKASKGNSSRNNRSQSITVGAAQTITVGSFRGGTPSRSLNGVQAQMGQQQSTFTSISNVVQGNYIGTNNQVRNSSGFMNNSSANPVVRRDSTDRLPSPRALCTNEQVKSARFE